MPLRTNPLQASLLCALLALAGCAAPGGTTPPTLTRATEIPAGSPAAGITIGKSTKAEVVALLGKTTSISFDSGFEVWVYHLSRESVGRQDAEKAEFVVLFSPAGVVTRTRIRPPTKPRS